MEFIDVSSATSITEPPEPENLLEECWFFGNLLIDGKSKMSKSYPDLGPSSNYNTREKMAFIRSEGSSSATPVKDTKGDNSDLRTLARGPSLPSCAEPKVDMFHPVKEKHDSRGSNWITQHNLIREQSLPPRLRRLEEDEDEDLPSCMEPKVDMFHPVKEKHDSGGSNWTTQNNLIREQSLPPRLRRQEEDEDEESDFMLGKLIRQASLNSSHILPPRHNSKVKSSSIQTKYPPRKKTEQLESNNMDMREQYLSVGTKIRRSSSDIQTKEVKGFKTLSCVQGNCRDKAKDKMINYPSTIPNWCDNEKRSSQDMKAEIKFWARAVASNVAAPSLSMAKRN